MNFFFFFLEKGNTLQRKCIRILHDLHQPQSDIRMSMELSSRWVVSLPFYQLKPCTSIVQTVGNVKNAFPHTWTLLLYTHNYKHAHWHIPSDPPWHANIHSDPLAHDTHIHLHFTSQSCLVSVFLILSLFRYALLSPSSLHKPWQVSLPSGFLVVVELSQMRVARMSCMARNLR